MAGRVGNLAVLFALLVGTIAHGGELTDPTRPPGAKPAANAAPAAPAVPVVSAIIVGEGRRIAIVNGTPVRAGDRIGDLTIEAVLDNGVRYTRSGTTSVSELPMTAARVRTDAGTQTRVGDSKQ